MSGDPSMLPEGSGEIAKHVGSAGGGGFVAFLLGRLFRGQDKAESEVISKLNVLQATVNRLSENVAVSLAEQKHAAADIATMKGQISALQQLTAAQEARIESLLSRLDAAVAE